MAKSKVKQLQEALAKGDLETAKRLAAEIEAKPKPTKSRKATKTTKAEKAPGRPRKRPPDAEVSEADEVPPEAPEASQGHSRQSRILLPGDVRYEGPHNGVSGGSGQATDGVWLAPTRGAPGDKVEARKVSMAGRQHVNLFDSWVDQNRGVDQLDAKARKVEKAIARSSTVPRPGQAGAMRPPAKKIAINCDGCGRHFEVYQSELTKTYEDNGRPYAIYKCDRCIRRGR